MLKQLAGFVPALLAFAFLSCSSHSRDEFERVMQLALPPSAEIEESQIQGDYALFIVHMPKADFAAFAQSLPSRYAGWQPVQGDISAELFAKHRTFDPRTATQYAVGANHGQRGGPGTFPVLVWDESTETLTAMMAGAWGG